MESITFSTIRPARGSRDLEATGQLFSAYAKALGVDLSFQDFATELNTLPGKYAPPKGEIFLACDTQNTAIGCVAVRPLPSDGCCEMKRLYVTPAGRGIGLGSQLVDAAIDMASHLGYREIRLDTLSSMHKARGLYEKVGFRRVEAYYNNPITDAVFYARSLTP